MLATMLFHKSTYGGSYFFFHKSTDGGFYFFPNENSIWGTPPSKDCRARTEEGRAAQRRRPTGISGRRRGLKSGGGGGAAAARWWFGFYVGGGNFFATDEKMQNTLGTLRLLEGPRTKKGGRAKMTEVTQTTFFRDFFGKEMSENSGLANQLTTGGGAPK